MKKHYVFTYFRGSKRKEWKFRMKSEKWAVRLCTWAMNILRITGAYCFMLEQGRYATSYWTKGMTRPKMAMRIGSGNGIDPNNSKFFDMSFEWTFDGDFWTHPRETEDGILIEEARTNLLPKL